jgi:hypothetical protein
MPRTEDHISPALLLLYCVLNVSTGIMNSLSYKKMLNAYKSQDPKYSHNYEVSQPRAPARGAPP